jgi:hypothetical protein
MMISRERHLDDTARHRVALVLQTATTEMHSLLADAPDDVREQVGDALIRALDAVEAALKPLLDRRTDAQATTDFGCGT